MKKTTKRFLSLALALVLCVSVAPLAFAASVRGDANMDDKINSTDALLILKYSVNKETEITDEYFLDVNGDGKINSTDALRTLKIAVGTDDPLTYSTAEILKFYSDAMMTTAYEVNDIHFTTTKEAKYKLTAPGEFYEDDINASDGMVINFDESGLDEDGYTPLDYLPYPWIDASAAKSVSIEKTENGYKVTVVLNSEKVTLEDEEPFPDNHVWYAGDCLAGFPADDVEEYTLNMAQTVYPGATIVAYISDAGYLTQLNADIPYIMTGHYLNDYDSYFTISFEENGSLFDEYTFVF